MGNHTMPIRLRSLIVAGLIGVARLSAPGAEPDLAAVRARFHPDDHPVRMEYDVTYRFLKIEMRHLGKVVLLTTTGTFEHRITGQFVPAALIEVRLDTPDRLKSPQRDRISIHDWILAVVSLPELYALTFGKETDEYMNPIVGHTRIDHTVSCYDTQSGRLEYARRDIPTGVISTNLSDPEAMMKLSRHVRPLIEFLMKRYRGQATAPDEGRLSVNADGEVVPLVIQTRIEQSPPFFQHQHMECLEVQTLPEKATRASLRRFEGWAIPFRDLADRYGSDGVRAAARGAMVESVVPLAVQYDLLLGSIRATLTTLGVGDASDPPDESATRDTAPATNRSSD